MRGCGSPFRSSLRKYDEAQAKKTNRHRADQAQNLSDRLSSEPPEGTRVGRAYSEIDMPLLKGRKARTKRGISENISREMRAGRPRSQAIAIAMNAAGKIRKPKSKRSPKRRTSRR